MLVPRCWYYCQSPGYVAWVTSQRDSPLWNKKIPEWWGTQVLEVRPPPILEPTYISRCAWWRPSFLALPEWPAYPSVTHPSPCLTLLQPHRVVCRSSNKTHSSWLQAHPHPLHPLVSHSYGLNCVSSKRYVGILTSSASEGVFTWKQGFHRGNCVRMRY